MDFLVGISRYLSEGHEWREFFTLSGTFSSLPSVISDSEIQNYNIQAYKVQKNAYFNIPH